MTHTKNSKSDAATRDESNGATPARPTDHASRQQTHKGQSSQTGSADLDREATRQGGSSAVPAKPPGAK